MRPPESVGLEQTIRIADKVTISEKKSSINSYIGPWSGRECAGGSVLAASGDIEALIRSVILT